MKKNEKPNPADKFRIHRPKTIGPIAPTQIQGQAPQPVRTSAPLPTEAPVQETDEQRTERVNRANKAIREILTKETCILMVPTLDISSGRVFPQIQVVAQPLK